MWQRSGWQYYFTCALITTVRPYKFIFIAMPLLHISSSDVQIAATTTSNDNENVRIFYIRRHCKYINDSDKTMCAEYTLHTHVCVHLSNYAIYILPESIFCRKFMNGHKSNVMRLDVCLWLECLHSIPFRSVFIPILIK